MYSHCKTSAHAVTPYKNTPATTHCFSYTTTAAIILAPTSLTLTTTTMATLRPQIYDAIIIGAGPAGLNAALAFARTLSTALVFDSHEYRNAGITHMHTVASRDHTSPNEFRTTARTQITSRYTSVSFLDALITHATQVSHLGTENGCAYSGFEVRDSKDNTYRGRKLILATGSKDVLPSIPGYRENWPQHIYQCLGCDGYEQRGSPIGVLGFAHPSAAHLVQMATAFDPRVTVFSNGPVSSEPAVQKALQTALAFGATLDTRPVVRMTNNGPSHLDGVTLAFETGKDVTLGFVVSRPPTVNRAQHLIEQLGVETVGEDEGGHVKVVNPMFNETSVRGVFAAGDTMVAMKQVAIAMAEGLKAAVGAAMQIAQERAEGKMGKGI